MSTTIVKLLIIFSIILFISCEDKEDSTSNNNPELIGNWTLIQDEEFSIITTNTDIWFPDSKHAGIGVINASGDVSSDLKFMEIKYHKGSYLQIHVMDCPIQFGNCVGSISSTNRLWLYQRFDWDYLQVVYISDNTYRPETIVFSFDSTDFTLSIQNSDYFLYDETSGFDYDTKVTINGTLSCAKLEVPAYTPTEIERYSEGFILGHFDELTITMNNNGTWHREQLFDDDEIFINDWSGTWEVADSHLLAIENYSYYDDEADKLYEFNDTLVFEYTMIQDTLLLSIQNEAEDTWDTWYWLNNEYDLEWGILTESEEKRVLHLIKNVN